MPIQHQKHRVLTSELSKKIDQKFDLSLVKVDQQRLKVKVCQFQNLNYR